MNWKQNSTIRQRDFGTHIVLVDPDKAMVHDLNEVGTFMWMQLDGTRSVDDVAQALTQKYKVVHSEALADVETFVQRLPQLGLLEAGHSGEGTG